MQYNTYPGAEDDDDDNNGCQYTTTAAAAAVAAVRDVHDRMHIYNTSRPFVLGLVVFCVRSAGGFSYLHILRWPTHALPTHARTHTNYE